MQDNHPARCKDTMLSLYKIFHPEIFQGSLKKRNYFEGWYFKHVSADGKNAFAVIPGISLSDDSHSFVQFIDGSTGKSSYFRYEMRDFIYSDKEFRIQIGRSVFTLNGLSLDLVNEDFRIAGKISNSQIISLPKSILMPGIMGWYSYIPGMECNHGVLSVDHNLSGSVTINNDAVDFTGGKGYIEKDWGTSFPESWLWLQCNNFPATGVSVMISVAKIPWRGSFFIGFIAFAFLKGRTEVFATYNGARVTSLKRICKSVTEICIRKGDASLKALITRKGSGTLKAPSDGLMNSIIKESLDSEVSVEISRGDLLLFSGNGIRAGYEETDKIFTYF